MQMFSRCAASSTVIVSILMLLDRRQQSQGVLEIHAHAPRSTFSVAAFAAHAVHGDRQLTVRPVATKCAHDFNRTRIAFIGISSGPNFGNSNLGVTAASPMDDEHDLIGF